MQWNRAMIVEAYYVEWKMPHKEILNWPDWVEEISDRDPGLGRILREAIVARDAAIKAGADEETAPKRCRSAFASAATTLDILRRGAVRPSTDAAWKKAADALQKFTQALDCAAPPQQALAGRTHDKRSAKRR